MELRFTKSFEEEYRKLAHGNIKLAIKVKKQLQLLQLRTNHPSLRLHKLGSSQYRSISVGKSIRILLIIEKEFIYIYHIGKHEDVY